VARLCAWIGNSALIANKLYLEVMGADFERGAKSDALEAQNAKQHPDAQTHMKSHLRPGEEGACEFASSDVAVCESTLLPAAQQMHLPNRWHRHSCLCEHRHRQECLCHRCIGCAAVSR